MEVLYFEKQFGSLCGMHCLNNAMQGEYFTVMDLVTIAEELDEVERNHMAQNGFDSQAYVDFLNAPSTNYDETGYFSVQVLGKALKAFFGLNIDGFYEQPPEVRDFPCNQRLFIVHMKDHWTCLRNFAGQWVDLNSLNNAPKPVSNLYLAEYLAMLKQEGHLIFNVTGNIPTCPGDEGLNLKNTAPKKTIMEKSDGKGLPLDVRQGEEKMSAAEIHRARREAFLKKLEARTASASVLDENKGSGAHCSKSTSTSQDSTK